MMRKTSVVAVLLSVTALLAVACTPGGPALNTWKVKPVSIKVVNDEDKDGGGDEPYAIQIGFRSKVGVPGSASASISSQCYAGQVPPINIFDPNAGSTPVGGTKVLGNGADITFPNAQNLDIGDVLLNTAPLEIFGTLTFAMERDAVLDSCAISDALANGVVPVLAQALNLLIANSPVPPTQQDLVNLIVNNLGNFLTAAANLIGAVIEGAGNPDDVLGVAAQIHLPTKGAFADLVNAGLGLAGFLSGGEIDGQGHINIPDLPAVLKVKVGNLLPSAQTFDFKSDGYEWILNTAIANG